MADLCLRTVLCSRKETYAQGHPWAMLNGTGAELAFREKKT